MARPTFAVLLFLSFFLVFLSLQSVTAPAPTPYTPPAVKKCKQPLIRFDTFKPDLDKDINRWREGRKLYQDFIRCMFGVAEFRKGVPKCASVSNSQTIFNEQTRDETGLYVGLGDPFEHLDDFLAWSKKGSAFERVCRNFMARNFFLLFINAQRNCTTKENDYCVPVSGKYASSTPYCTRLNCFESPGSICKLATPDLRFGRCTLPSGADCPGVGLFNCDDNLLWSVPKLNCKNKRTTRNRSSPLMMKILRKVANKNKRDLCSDLRCRNCGENTRDDPCKYSSSLCCNCMH